MAIGVFIAPILLYWEALSSPGPRMASISLLKTCLADPPVAPALTVGRPNEKRIPAHLENLVAVGRPGRNPTEYITEVCIEQCVGLYIPPTGESRNHYGLLPDLAMKCAVGAERISTALHLICVKPIADKWGSAWPIESRAAGKNRSEDQRQNRFHEECTSSMIHPSHPKRNRDAQARLAAPQKTRATLERVALALGYSKFNFARPEPRQRGISCCRRRRIRPDNFFCRLGWRCRPPN
jgi:hypothetical protein